MRFQFHHMGILWTRNEMNTHAAAHSLMTALVFRYNSSGKPETIESIRRDKSSLVVSSISSQMFPLLLCADDIYSCHQHALFIIPSVVSNSTSTSILIHTVRLLLAVTTYSLRMPY